MSWQNPAAFVFLIVLGFIIAWNFWERKKKTPTLQFSSLMNFAKLAPAPRSQLSRLPELLKVLALIFAILALARPQKADEKIKKNVEGIDIMIALDISDSMLIEDMTPENRMEAAKLTIQQFIQKRVSDRIGLVVFAGESYTRVPLTLDYPVLLQSLKEVQTAQNMKMGTAIGVALANAVSRLKDSVAKSRVVVLLTDGENNTGTVDPEQTALQIAKGYGVRVYTIGVGKDGDARLPRIVTDVFGRQVKQYQPIHSTVNDELLGNLAKQTGGKFYRAEKTKGLEEVFADIDSLEKTKIDVSKFTRYAELYPPFLLAAIAFYFFSILLGQTVLRRGP